MGMKIWASLVAQLVKKLPTMQDTQGSIPGLGRSPGEGNGNPLQYSCLENPTDCSLPGSSVHGITRVGHNLATKPLPPWKYLWDPAFSSFGYNRNFFLFLQVKYIEIKGYFSLYFINWKYIYRFHFCFCDLILLSGLFTDVCKLIIHFPHLDNVFLIKNISFSTTFGFLFQNSTTDLFLVLRISYFNNS